MIPLYSVIRSSRNGRDRTTVETVVASGLPLEQARAEAARLGAVEQAAKPLGDSWTWDHFVVQLEGCFLYDVKHELAGVETVIASGLPLDQARGIANDNDAVARIGGRPRGIFFVQLSGYRHA